MARRRTVWALVFAIAFTVCASVAYALRPYSSEWEYYSDELMTEVVGAGYTDCQWHYTQFWGVQTPYFIETRDPCGTRPSNGK